MKKYFIFITIISLFSINSHSVLAQACNIAAIAGTGATLSSNCSISVSTVDGVDDGSGGSTSANGAVLVVNNSLTIGGTLVAGQIIIGNGAIATINGTIQMHVPLWLPDADNDGFANLSGTPKGQASQPALYVRKGGAVSDTNDGVACSANSCYGGNGSCQKCVSGAPANLTAGKVCNAGNEVSPSSTSGNYCATSVGTTVTTTANTCTGTTVSVTSYRACQSNGSCYSDNTSAYNVISSPSNLYAASGRVFTNTTGTTATANVTNNCSVGTTTVLGACNGRTIYYGCNGGGSCTGVGSSIAINAAAAKVYSNATGSTLAAGVGYSCGIGTGTTYTTVGSGCSGTSTNYTYFRGCNGSGSCYSDNTGAGSSSSAGPVINAANGRIFTNTVGITAVPNATYKCAVGTGITLTTVASGCSGVQTNVSYFRACNGSGSCRSDNTGAGSSQSNVVLNIANGRVATNTTGTTAVPNATYKCSTYASCTANTCTGTIYYRACGGAGSCRGDNTGAGSAAVTGVGYSQVVNASCSIVAGTCTSGVGCTTYYHDGDGDNHGDATDPRKSCANPMGVGISLTVDSSDWWDTQPTRRCWTYGGVCDTGCITTQKTSAVAGYSPIGTWRSCAETCNLCGFSPNYTCATCQWNSSYCFKMNGTCWVCNSATVASNATGQFLDCVIE